MYQISLSQQGSEKVNLIFLILRPLKLSKFEFCPDLRGRNFNFLGHLCMDAIAGAAEAL